MLYNKDYRKGAVCMPPKPKITREMILEAAFEIVRNEGIKNVNARNISKKLSCSTQPVLYYFSAIEEIKDEVYKKVDEYHSDYIMNIQGRFENPMLEIGLLYIKFAAEESNLFKFLFQSNKYVNKNFDELMAHEEIKPILEILSQEIDVEIEIAKEIFTSIFLLVHGLASMLANNSMVYDEEYIIKIIGMSFVGIVSSFKGESL